MNRRLAVFLAVFLVVCASGLVYTYSISPTYVASARIQVDPGTNPDRPQDATAFVANEAQTLTSNRIFESVLAEIGKMPAFWKFGAVPHLREALSASSSPGTNVIELHARGSEPELLTQLLAVWARTYLASRGTRSSLNRELGIDEARKAVASFDSRVARKRHELDEFRRRNSIVSPEREENEVAAQMRSLTGALNDARNKATEAESRLSTVKASLAQGKAVYRAQDKAEIAQLEQRALALRQKLKDLELNFTPQYLAIDPSVKAMHANIQQIEKQIEDIRRSSQQASMNEAAQDALTAQKNVAQLEAQFNQRRNDALKFTSRFAEHRAHSTELEQLEAQLDKAKQRLALLERGERTREPTYELLGLPAVADKPVHPNYALYLASSIGGAFAAALLAVLLVEFLTPRPRVEPAYPQPIIQIAYPALSGTHADTLRLASVPAALPGSPGALPVPSALPLRELTVREVRAVWDAATRNGRLAVAALFSGLTLEELAALRWQDIDLHAQHLMLAGRLHPLNAPLAQELQDRGPGQIGAESVAVMSNGVPLSALDLSGLVAAAMHDAGIDNAEALNHDVLRHTYISFLVRQGLRLSELEKWVGPVAPASFLHYRNLSSREPGAPPTAVNPLYPAFARA